MSTQVHETSTWPTVQRHATHKSVIAALLAGAALAGIYGVVRVVDRDQAQPPARNVAATGMSTSDTGLALILGAGYPVVAGGRTLESTVPGPAPATGDAVTSTAVVDPGLDVVFGPTAIAAGTPGP